MYRVSGTEVAVEELDGRWRVRAGGTEIEHRFLDRALAQALGVSSLTATELAAEMLRRPEGGTIG